MTLLAIWNSLSPQQKKLVCFLAKRSEADILEQVNNI